MKNTSIFPLWAVDDSSGVENLFNENKSSLNIEYDFEVLKKFTHTYVVYTEHKLVGCVYYFQDFVLEQQLFNDFKITKGGGGHLLFMSGFAKRKNHLANLFAISETAKYYKENIYSFTTKKPAVFCLMTAGFKKIKPKAKGGSNESYLLFKPYNS